MFNNFIVSLGLKALFKTMKKFGVLAMIIAVLCLTGCGVATTVSNNVTETKIVLSENNFKVVGQAYGQAQATYICGIGGLSRKALRNNAINELSKNANLKGAQTLTNITTHFSVKMIPPLYVQVTCTATANIVEFK